jgi:hypothetical protein
LKCQRHELDGAAGREFKLITLKKYELCHRDIAFVSMAEDAHILLQHAVMSLLPMHPVNHSNCASSLLFCITLSSFAFCIFSLRSRLHEKIKVSTAINIPGFST